MVMAPTPTTTQTLADSLDTIVASARIVREYRGVMPNVVDRVTLDPNTGMSWKEITLAKLNAQDITETTVLNNAQQFSDTAITAEPTLVGLQTFVTDRVARRISRLTLGRMGQLAQNAMQRKKDVDGLAVLDGFSNSTPGSGNVLSFSNLQTAVYNVKHNTTEPAPEDEEAFGILHGFQILDIENELVAPVGTEAIPAGISADVFRNNFSGRASGAMVMADDNITISGNNAKGGVFVRSAIVLVQGVSPYVLPKAEPGIGGGGTSLFHYDEYVWTERTSQGTSVFGWEIFSDATAPS